MDRVGAENIRIVLITLVGLTIAVFGVMLWLVVDGQEVPTLLVGTSTTLLGLLTGSVVNLGAPPRVDAAQRAATDAAFEVRMAAKIPALPAPAAPAIEVDEWAEATEKNTAEEPSS